MVCTCIPSSRLEPTLNPATAPNAGTNHPSATGNRDFDGDLHWPFVSGSIFSFDGVATELKRPLLIVSGTGSSQQWTKPLKGTSSKGSASITEFYAMQTQGASWKTLQLAFTYTGDGTLAEFGGISLKIKNSHLWFAKDKTLIDVAPLVANDFNDVQIVKHYDSLLAYVNGDRASRSITPTKPFMPVEIGFDSWKGTIIAVAGYGRELSVDEMYANENAARTLAKSLFADTPKVTVEAELDAMTPIPDIDKIRPYRSALLAEEYKVIRITAGRMSALKPGMKIRIYRWGIRAGEKTALKTAKIGDHHEMVIQSYASDPKFEREFQVDNLDPDISIPLYVDVTPDR